jgi:hypothetical protein
MKSAARCLLILALSWPVTQAWAQPFKLQCEVEGKFADAQGKPTLARVAIELQVIGRHMYFTVIGPRPFEMRVSTLVTEEYEGSNLTSASQLGARRRHRSSGQETSLFRASFSASSMRASASRAPSGSTQAMSTV